MVARGSSTEAEKKKGRGKTQRGYILNPRKRYASYKKRSQGFFKCVTKHEENFRSCVKLLVHAANLSVRPRNGYFRYITGANDNVPPNKTKCYWDEPCRETDSTQRKKGARGPAYKGYIQDYKKRRESMKKRIQGLFLCAILFAENFRADITLEVTGDLDAVKGKPYYYRFVTGATDNILPVFTKEYLKRWIEANVVEQDVDEFINEFQALLETSGSSSTPSPASSICYEHGEQGGMNSSDALVHVLTSSSASSTCYEQGGLHNSDALGFTAMHNQVQNQCSLVPTEFGMYNEFMEPCGIYTQDMQQTTAAYGQQTEDCSPVTSLYNCIHEEVQTTWHGQNMDLSQLDASQDDDFDVSTYLNDSYDHGDDGLGNHQDSSSIEAQVNNVWSYEELNNFLLDQD